MRPNLVALMPDLSQGDDPASMAIHTSVGQDAFQFHLPEASR